MTEATTVAPVETTPATAPSTLLTEPAASTEPAAATIDKPAEGTKPEGEKAPTEAAKPEDAKPAEPITYDFKLPEGIELDEKVLTDFKSMASTDGLTQDQAQKYLDVHVKALQEAQQAPQKLWDTTKQEWQQAAKADPEYGGQHFDANRGKMAAAIDHLMGDKAAAFRQALDFTGAGDNPEIIRGIFRMAKAVTEGGPVGGSPSGAASKSAAEKLYPTQSSS